MEVDSIYDLATNSGNSANSAGSGNQPQLSKAIVNVGLILYSEYRTECSGFSTYSGSASCLLWLDFKLYTSLSKR